MGSYWRRFISQDYAIDKNDVIDCATMARITRRAFLQSTSMALLAGTIARAGAADPKVTQRLESWEYRRGSLGGPWEAWRKVNDDANTWTKVQVPHCFNAFDAVDPDAPYY